jgi:hypothetical protein
MKDVIAWIAANPELVGVGILVLESALMPFIPVKWNGLAILVLGVLKKKFLKATPVPVEPTREEKIKSDMQKAVDEYNKRSAEDKLGQ